MNHPYFEDFTFKIEDNEEKEEKLSRNRSRVSHQKKTQATQYLVIFAEL